LRATTTLTVATMIATTGIASKSSNASTPVRELPESFLLAGLSGFDRWSDDPHQLKPGAVYTAHNLPVPIRLTIQGGGWTGAQWKSARLVRGTGGAPYFGWAVVGRGGGTVAVPHPKGLIAIMTAYGSTPSVSATVAHLRQNTLHVTYSAIESTHVAGFAATSFDGQVAAGRLHVFMPFGTINHFADSFFAEGSENVRVIVVRVRSRTLVIYIDGANLTPSEFPSFADSAERLLRTLRFPR
jgi:hypothetical protein